MKKFTANYSYTNHNFVIQNINEQRIDNEYLSAICILKNILQRGKPTLLSKFLQKHIGQIHKENDFLKPYPLIDKEQTKWERIVRGDVKGNYFPAKKFYDELIPKYFGEYKFIQQLIIPEIPINEITKVEVDAFVDQQVDFYLPQAYLIIEIDGSDHEANNDQDKLRDTHTAKYGIKTVRIRTGDIETESSEFVNKVDEIINYIKKASLSQKKRKEKDPLFISIEDYKNAFENEYHLTNPNYKATAIIRFQILILELLENGLLKFNKDWEFEIIETDVKEFAELAIDDLFIWFEHIFNLQKVQFIKPKFSISRKTHQDEFSSDAHSIKIDFSMLKRYTDEFQTKTNIVFVRTDYLDEYRFFKKGDSRDKLKFAFFEQYDYFKISTTNLIKYKFSQDEKDSYVKSLLFLLGNIFLQDVPNLTFNEGQLPLITNALMRNDTIGLLPTGSGKSVCYQLSAILQPAISFVVCPIKALMYDQKADLDLALFTRINHITHDDDAEDKEKKQNEFKNGKYFFIFISPERFQVKTFREYFSTGIKDFKIAYAIIDEVHCLSEWGHDFRTAYLNLSNTIHKLCSDFNFIGLTATASINVLKDIQIEFAIKQENVKTPANYTREELEFHVIDDNNDKYNVLKKLLSDIDDDQDIFNLNGSQPKCGIIFTTTVNGSRGCYRLYKDLSNHLTIEAQFYSGSVPEVDGNPIMTDTKFDEYKKEVQQKFKGNQLRLIAATKAFGMGVNKGNIYYTIHYGIPGSMESLYQEAGRAGRDKEIFNNEKAKCYVLLSKHTRTQEIFNEIFNIDTPFSKLIDKIKNGKKVEGLINKINGDLNTNLFLFAKGLNIIKNDYDLIKKIYKKHASPNVKRILVKGTTFGSDKLKTEKAIYRLNQLGIITDWTVKDFFGNGKFEIDFDNYTFDSIKKSLLSTIQKYDSEFSLPAINTNDKYKSFRKIINNTDENFDDFDKYILILLQWSYDNFTYNRRQSLKNIYENCCDFANGLITSSDFKLRLENYFKFTESSYLLQYIAENPKDYKMWFEVFSQIDNNIKTDKFISCRQQESLRDSLSRFLESQMYNTGLDLISGLLRLLLNDYENIDGRKRLESSLIQIRNYKKNEIDFILENILRIGTQLSYKSKNELAESIYKFFKNKKTLFNIYISLEDKFSMSIIIKEANIKLKEINSKIYDRLRKTG